MNPALTEPKRREYSCANGHITVSVGEDDISGEFCGSFNPRHPACNAFLKKRTTPTDAVQIMNEVASTVVAGNRNREALMVTNFTGLEGMDADLESEAWDETLRRIALRRPSEGHFGLCDECNGEHYLDGAYVHDDCGGTHDFKGWYCTRAAGHDGPCALWPIPAFFNPQTWKPRPLWKVWLGLR